MVFDEKVMKVNEVTDIPPNNSLGSQPRPSTGTSAS